MGMGRLEIKYSLMVIMISISLNAYSFESLTDDEMDKITAGSASSSENEIVGFEFNRQLGRGRHIEGSGSMDYSASNISKYTSGSLNLSDNAQNNLSALININAVNSPVQVLLNLNININSTVGSVNQSNFALPPLVR